MTGHSRYAPSSADRWAVCQLSLLPYSGPSCRTKEIYADKGTACHKAAAEAIRRRVDPIELVLEGAEFHGMPLTVDMAESVDVYVTAVRRVIEAEGYAYYLEQRVEVPDIHDECGGTADAALHSEREKHIIVADYKSGFEDVQPDSYQLAIYLRGCVDLFNIDDPKDYKFTAAIIQPLDKENPVKLKHYGWKDLSAAIRKLKNATKQNNAVAGPHCKYCPHAAVCDTLDEFSREALDDMPADPEIFHLSAGELNPGRVADILDSQDTVKIWFAAVANYAATLIGMKIDVRDYEMRDSLGDRFYTDPEAAERALLQQFGNDIYEPRKLRSPAQIETVWPKAKPLVKTLVSRKMTGAKLKKVKPDVE